MRVDRHLTVPPAAAPRYYDHSSDCVAGCSEGSSDSSECWRSCNATLLVQGLYYDSDVSR